MDSSNKESGSSEWWRFWSRRRHIVSFLAFFGFFNVYSLRVNLSVAIVAMTSNLTTVLPNGTQIQREAEFPWDSKLQGVILSSFFYGYICTQLVGGWLATRVGGARLFCLGIAATAVATLFTPPVASLSVYAFIALRILEGIFEGVTYPCIHAVWSQWAPPAERSAMTSFAFSGSYLGTVVSLPLSGLLAQQFGWQYVFYVTGIIGVVWCFVWMWLVRDRPDQDPRISKEELDLIQMSLGTKNQSEKIIYPWKDICKSVPVWAVVVAHFCENWGFYTLLTQLPTFMKDILEFDLNKTGFMSSVPYLVMGISLQFAGKLADYMCNKQVLSTTNVRKLFNCGAFIGQTIFMTCAANLLTPAGVVTCLVMAVGLGAFAWPAFSVNHLDLAPQYASVLMGLSNTFATIPGIISPLITGYIVTNKTEAEWKIVFYIASTIYLLGAIFYGVYASAERQPWAMIADNTEERTSKGQADGTGVEEDERPPSYDNLALSLHPSDPVKVSTEP